MRGFIIWALRPLSDEKFRACNTHGRKKMCMLEKDKRSLEDLGTEGMGKLK
jgi:hypothetical protein